MKFILSVLFLPIVLVASQQRTKRQIIYDSPPIGVSLTRPALPWLARYFVGATKPEYFLDEPQRGPTLPSSRGPSMGGMGQGGGPGGGMPPDGGPDGMMSGGGPGMPSAGGPDGMMPAGAGVGPSFGDGISPSMPLMSLRQREQMRQLAYMPQVPVPVLSAPLYPRRSYLPPIYHVPIAAYAAFSPPPPPPPPEPLPVVPPSQGPLLEPSGPPLAPIISPAAFPATPAHQLLATPASFPPSPAFPIAPPPAFPLARLPPPPPPPPSPPPPGPIPPIPYPFHVPQLTGGALSPPSPNMFYRDIILNHVMPQTLGR